MVQIRAFVENNLYIVAGIALGVAVAQLLGKLYPPRKIRLIFS